MRDRWPRIVHYVRVRRAIWIPVLVVVILGAGSATAAAVYDHGRRDTIAPGITIAGVPVGDMKAADARAKVEAALRKPLDRTFVVHAGGHTFHLSAEALATSAAVAPLVDQAVARSRKGGLFTRALRGIKGD